MVQLNKVEINGGLSVYRVAMLDGLKKLAGAIGGKNIPILSAVEIVVTEKEIVLTATDADIIILVKLENDDSGFIGKFVVDYKSFVAFLKKSKSDTINLQYVNTSQVSVKADKITYNLLAHDKDEYPLVPNLEFDTVTVTKKEFETALKNTLYAVATSESRPTLTGVNVTYDKNGLKFVATDSHRLAQYELWSHTTDSELKAVPHGEHLKKALKIVDKKCEHVVVGFSDYYTLVQFDNVEVYARNLEGNYPDTSRLIPDDFKTEISMNISDLKESLDMMQVLFLAERNHMVTMEIEENNVQMYAKKPETHESMQSEIETSNFNGNDLKLGFNGTYLMDVLKTIDKDYVLMQFNGAMRPFIIKPDKNITHLILPIRTY